jgi:hypothetical protein
MQCYDNKNAFSSFTLDVFIQNRLRSYFTLLRSFRSFPGSRCDVPSQSKGPLTSIKITCLMIRLTRFCLDCSVSVQTERSSGDVEGKVAKEGQ